MNIQDKYRKDRNICDLFETCNLEDPLPVPFVNNELEFGSIINCYIPEDNKKPSLINLECTHKLDFNSI